MKLLDIIQLKELQQVQDLFAQATGLAAVTVDMDGNWITKPSNFTDFCQRFAQREPAGGCQGCGAQKPGVYQCPAGLTNFYQLLLLNGEPVCALLGGQALEPGQSEEVLRHGALSLGAPEEEGLQALKNAPVCSEKQVQAAAELAVQSMNNLIALRSAGYDSRTQDTVLTREMTNMVEKTKEIARKTLDLKKISTQQKLLSINAAIEAGRAGDAGKGFRIVADQMGKLAESSAEIYEGITEDSNVIYDAVERMKGFRNER